MGVREEGTWGPPVRVLASVLALLLVVPAIVVLPAAAAVDPGLCYAVADDIDHLVSVPRSGGGTSDIGQVAAGATVKTDIEAIAIAPAPAAPHELRIYGVHAGGGELGRIDDTTAAWTSIGSLGSGSGPDGSQSFADTDGLTYDAFRDLLWGSVRRNGAADLLIAIDRATGTPIAGRFDVNGDSTLEDYAVVTGTQTDIDDLAMDPTTGVLYGIASGSAASDQLVTIDVATGVASVVGTLTVGGSNLLDVEGLDFAGDGTLYASTGGDPVNPPDLQSAFFQVDKATGAATQIDADDDTGDLNFEVGADHEALACMAAPANTVSGTVFLDDDGDGALDAGEGGIAGVTVELWLDDGDGAFDPVGDQLGQVTTTGGDGTYAFLGSGDVDGFIVVDDSDPALPAGAALTDPPPPGPAVLPFSGFATTSTGNNVAFALPAVGDLVWNDIDADGVQDAGEPGVGGVVVSLLDPALVKTTTTAVDGSYRFSEVAPGTYSVAFDLGGVVGVAGFTTQDAGADDVDSDPDPVSAETTTFTLSDGEQAMTWDAGVLGDAAITGTVWHDADEDGIEDPTERAVEDVAVELRASDGSSVLSSTITAADGTYTFANLLPGDYIVAFVVPTGSLTTQTIGTVDGSDPDPVTGLTDVIVLGAGETSGDIDAGVVGSASIGDLAWNDIDGDGIQDTGEPGVEGVTVRLLTADGLTVLDTTTTDATGTYGFSSLLWGDYVVEFDLAGVSGAAGFTTRTTGTADGSDPDPTDGRVGVTLAAGEANADVDAGVLGDASVGDLVWNDIDADGIQDATEPGVGGVTVELRSADGITLLSSTATAADGSYVIDDVLPGTYTLVVLAPPGTTFTTQTLSTADGSDVDPTTGAVAVALSAAEVEDSIDAGLLGDAIIGDLVWFDADGDGLQDPDEPGVAGAVVRLYAADGTTLLAVTTTSSTGAYTFAGAVPDDYVLEFDLGGVAGAGGFTSQTTGTTDGSDPDPTNGRVAFTAVSGTNDDLDAGVLGDASIGDLVWFDADGDGLQDTGEPGVAGAVVRLLTADGAAVLATDTTDAAGAYLFTGLLPGDYRIEFDLTGVPGAAGFTTADVASDDTVDSDADPVTGRTAVITVATAATIDHVDAGMIGDAAIGNLFWNDLDGDGLQDAGEPGLVGVTVRLFAADGATLLDTQTTDADGAYTFADLLPGDYVVVFTAPSGLSFTAQTLGTADGSDADPVTGATPTITLTAGEVEDGIDAGVLGGAALGDLVWNDIDGDGIQDPDEPGVEGLTIRLIEDDGVTVAATTTSDPAGAYAFTGIAPGDYFVEFDTSSVAGASLTSQTTGTATGSDPDPVTGRSPLLTLVAGSTDDDIDAGLVGDAAIGDFVWNDIDGDGLQDAGEPGIGGVTVELLASDGTTRLASTTTEADGAYGFVNLLAGDYVVGFVAPTDTTFTIADVPGPLGSDTTDSDADPGTGLTGAVSLSVGETDDSVDAGLLGAASIGDVVWNDIDGDGVQDVGEPGAAGVTVRLFASDGVTLLSSTTTGVDGVYGFANLLAGDYVVGFVAPAGATLTAADVGADDAVDSDADAGTGLTAVVSLAAVLPAIGLGRVTVAVEAPRDATVGRPVELTVELAGRERPLKLRTPGFESAWTGAMVPCRGRLAATPRARGVVGEV
ncbi:MAG: carboxypeptidase regulatory-like domain-containing protein, partial [Actinobacteria bacterium]|nr:carboxypeptidase regulatory-like domain-containing protein [Actinomycetota bacterium]